MQLGKRRVNPFTLTPVRKPVIPGIETNPWFWNPSRGGGLYKPPATFVEDLEKVDDKLAVVWNPVRSNWQLFIKDQRFNSPICSGWKLLFIHHDGKGGYLPLDNRLFARLYAADMRNWGSAKRYFDQVQAQVERDREREENRYRQEVIDTAMPFFEHSQIKNIGKGSKFVTYHS